MHMKKRLTYEAPEAELVLVRFEDNFLSPGVTLNGRIQGEDGNAGYIGDDFTGDTYNL